MDHIKLLSTPECSPLPVKGRGKYAMYARLETKGMRVERPVAKVFSQLVNAAGPGDVFLPLSPIVSHRPLSRVPVCIWRSHSERLRLLPIQGLRATLAWLTAAVICFNQNPSHFISRLESPGSNLQDEMFLPDSKVAIIFIYVYIYIIIITNLQIQLSNLLRYPLSSRAVQNGRERERSNNVSWHPREGHVTISPISRGVNEIGLQSRIFYT